MLYPEKREEGRLASKTESSLVSGNVKELPPLRKRSKTLRERTLNSKHRNETVGLHEKLIRNLHFVGDDLLGHGVGRIEIGK